MPKVASKKHQTTLLKWICERFSIKNPAGLILTIGVIIGIICLGLFLIISNDSSLKESLFQADLRILNIFSSMRTAERTSFFSVITFLGNWQSIVFFSFITCVFLLRRKQIFTGILFLSTLITAETLTFVLKHEIARARPEQALSLVAESSFSFPSGHALAATVAFGFLAYLLIKSFKYSWSKMAIFLGCIFAIVLVALSRIYLGAHYPIDVLASIALGSFLLSISITIAKVNQRYAIFRQPKTTDLKELLIVPALLIIFSLISKK